MADQIGRVLGGRYRILAPIGTGASAHVYLGEDVTLRRRVALKVLHPALADDDGEIPYLVCEFLGGGSLRAMLDRGHRLTPSQALLVGLEASRGLDYAHRR